MRPNCIDEKDFKYSIPSDEDMVKRKRWMEKYVGLFQKKARLEEYDIKIDYLILYKVFIRIDKRKDYFQYFHSDDNQIMRISQDKEIALLAYWIVKYKPFRLKTVEQEESFFERYLCSINEMVASMLIVHYLCQVDQELINIFDSNRINLLIYDLLNRNISKSALIMYVESFLPLRNKNV